MRLHHWKGYIVFFFLALYTASSAATNLPQCLADVISCAQNASGSVCISSLNISSATALSILFTSTGSPVSSPSEATALSYTGCTEYCGPGPAPFSWTVFAQEYSAWLLPYLALLSQLPFGAQHRLDNLMSVVLTLGSPTLAGYSLYMTLLNTRWVNDQLFSGIDYPSAAVRRSVVRVLSRLQQVPLRVHPGQSAEFESLVVHPDNDDWWTILAEELNYSQTWSIASATSIAWVVLAYLLTVADSLSNIPQNFESNGQGIGSGLLWLVPIVIGWLVLSPKCDHDRVHDAYRRANRHVFVVDSRDALAAPSQVTCNFGLTITPSPDWKLGGGDITSPDELRTPPVFNYARILPWYQNVYRTFLVYLVAWQKSNRRIGVDDRHFSGNMGNSVPKECRLGTRDQIIHYCRADDRQFLGANALWPRGLLFNMVVASLMSLLLQWGTVGSAVVTYWFTPTFGIGCRTFAYLVYGALSTAVWMLLVSSSMLGYYAHHVINDLPAIDVENAADHASLGEPPDPNAGPTARSLGLSNGESSVTVPLREIHAPNGNAATDNVSTNIQSNRPTRYPSSRWISACTIARTIARVADWLRWTGKSLAIINAITVIANAFFQFAGTYSNCYCNSSVYSWGASAFNVINPTASDIDLIRKAWIGSLALALTCCSVFVGSIYLIWDTLPS